MRDTSTAAQAGPGISGVGAQDGSPEAAAAPEPAGGTALTPARLRQIILVLAIACGMAVANIYYAQPLLAPIASAFGVSQGQAALVVTLTQLGYALGMLLLLPLGDGTGKCRLDELAQIPGEPPDELGR